MIVIRSRSNAVQQNTNQKTKRKILLLAADIVPLAEFGKETTSFIFHSNSLERTCWIPRSPGDYTAYMAEEEEEEEMFQEKVRHLCQTATLEEHNSPF